MPTPERSPLSYQPPDPKRLRRKRLALAALVLSAVSLAIVGRLLYGKFAGPIERHLATWSAQRRVLALDPPGRAIDYTENNAANPSFDFAVLRYVTTYAPFRAFALWPLNPLTGGVAYVGPIDNAAGASRIIVVQWTKMPASPADTTFADVGCTLLIRERVGLFWPETPLDTDLLHRLPLLRGQPIADVSFAPPRLDPANARRLLIAGTVSNRPFAFELTIDAKDRPHVFPLEAPTR